MALESSSEVFDPSTRDAWKRSATSLPQCSLMAFRLNKFRPKVESVLGPAELGFASPPSVAQGAFLSGLLGERRGEIRAEPDFFIISVFFQASICSLQKIL